MTEGRKLKVFQILEKNQFNTGSVHQMFQAAEGLLERGHEVTVITRPDPVMAEKAKEAGLGFAALPFRNDLDFKSIRLLRTLIRSERPDVIHVHKGMSQTIALAASWFDPIPAFVANRGVSFPLKMWNRGKYATRRVDCIITVCEQIRQVVIKSGRISPEKVKVVFAGVDLDLFDPDLYSGREFREEKNIDPGAFLFLQVGVRDWKGWRELIDSFSDVVPEEGRKTHLALIACKSPEQEAEVLAHAQSRGVGDRVSAVEYRSDMARVMASADCVVDASWAGTGITGTIREAMAMQKPVIATDCGGNRELLSSPEFGWLVPERDRNALARAMQQVLSNPVRASEVARNGMTHVRNGFTVEQRLDNLETIYSAIVRKNERRRNS